MLLLDTNVLSALMRDAPDPVVVAWLDGAIGVDLWTTAVNVFEIRHGLARLPSGKRRAALTSAFERLLAEDLADKVAGLDAAAASLAGNLAARREASGRPVDLRDTLIAGVALSRGAALATRNVRHFEDAGIALVDPWAAS